MADDDSVWAGAFAGHRSDLFWLSLKTGLWTVLTLGIYRFWMKTRLRRWYWSAVRIGSQPLEYVGDPIEKLLGFLIAVVILAFYIGIVNLLLMFVSFSLFQGNYFAYFLSFIGVIPIWFYAQYRARRYVLARTRWCGLRFGLDPGAWRFACLALGYWALTILSLGLLWPLMTFKLEQYKTDRMSFGTSQFVQGGRWTMLYRSAIWLFIGLLIAGTSALMIYSQSQSAGFIDDFDAYTRGILVGFLALLVLPFGLIHYRINSLQRLTETKRLAGMGLSFQPSTLRVVGIYLGGYIVASLGIGVFFGLLAIAGLTFGGSLAALKELDIERFLIDYKTMLFVISGMSYFAIFLLWSAFTQAFVTMPILRHYASVLVLNNPDQLGGIRQRPRDEHIEAEGFAEALDVGASI